MARDAPKFARKVKGRSVQIMEKKPQTWQRRGVFALVSKRLPSDVLGSYTGIPEDPEDEQPVQDADDL